MDETETLITQLGLLLTQTRFARRALEDIERATSTYGTFAFTSVIAAGPRFGEPPLIEGALKVHVVNIGDLAPGGGGLGDLLAGLLGGAGAFVGNLSGGIVGGTISSWQLVKALPTIKAIAESVERILTMLGIVAPDQEKEKEKAGETAATGKGSPVAGTNVLADYANIVDAVTGLFLAASGRPEQATPDLPSTERGTRWKALLDSAAVVLAASSRLVDGLIVALPVAVGSLAWLINRLPAMRVAIAETLQFALRVALLVRGAVLVTAFDTLAVVARMGATVVGLLATTVDAVLVALFDTVRKALSAALDVGAVLGGAVKDSVDALLNWLVPTVDAILRNLADLRAFRVLTHVVRILPAILPPIHDLARSTGTPPLSREVLANLDAAARAPFLAPLTSGSGPTPAVPPAPDFAGVITSPETEKRLKEMTDRLERVTTGGLTAAKDAAHGGLRALGTRLDAAAQTESRLSGSTLDRHLAGVRTQSETLSRTLVVPDVQTLDTGLEKIATAYEGWLTGGGLDTLLATITRHFSTEPGRSAIPPLPPDGMDRPRATVQIDEVVVDVGAAPVPLAPHPPPLPDGPGVPLPDVPLPDDTRPDPWRFVRGHVPIFDFESIGGR